MSQTIRIHQPLAVEEMEQTTLDKRKRRRNMDKNLFSVFVVILLWTESGQIVNARSVGQGEEKETGVTTYRAPEILQNPPAEMAYKTGEPVTLPCNATGEPAPTFRWEKDGVKVEDAGMAGVELRKQDGRFDLYIASADGDYDGYYQCFASNSYGTAVSTRTKLQKAVLAQFIAKPVEVHQIDVGQPLVLRCNPPLSYPAALVYWGETSPTSKVRPIETSERVALDYNGNMYFAHVNASDSRNGRTYVCLATNTRIRTIVQGDDQLIKPKKVEMESVAPKLMWYSAEPTGLVVGIKGQQVKMKCIFSGYPTPKVSFSRVDGAMQRHMVMQDDSHNHELVIDPVSTEDEGQYRCSATNSATETPVNQDIKLLVESAPYWQDKPIQNQNIDEGEGAVFSCLVEGSPTPSVSWLVNGKPVQELPPHPRRSVTEYTMTFMNVTNEDNQVIQCNATNKHGSLFYNAHLTVRSEPPTFLERPAALTKVIEGGEVTLKCRGAGAPKPYVAWYMGEHKYEQVQPTEVLSEQELNIKSATEADEGEYHCQLSNKYGTDDTTAHIEVLKKISILPGSQQNESAVTGSEVTLTCDVTADRHDNVVVTWWRGKTQLLDESVGGWYSIREEEGGRYLLTLTGTTVDDSGEYTCRVNSDVDEAEIPINLIIRDKPDPPIHVTFSDCNSDVTELSWQPGSDNNEPITGYVIKHVTSLDELGDGPREYNVTAEHLKFSINLEPYRNHTFYISARNALGSSTTVGAGTGGSGLCTSPPAPPSVNPTSVCTELGTSDQLIVTWKPIARDQLNGPGFYYLVSFTRLDEKDADEEVRLVSDYKASRLIVPGQPPFKPYSVFVQAGNDVGKAEEEVTKYKMRSGEAAPQVSPKNFQLVKESMNGSGALFEWDPVDVSRDDEIRGYFKGYQLRYWKKENPEDVRPVDLILRPDPDLCPLTPEPAESESTFRHKKRRRREGEEGGERVGLYITNMWSSSELMAGVAVLNGAGGGTLSDVITFTTPAGPPEAVENLAVFEVGSFHMKFSWQPPPTVGEADNITGYLVTYKSVSEDGVLSNSQFIRVLLPSDSTSSLLDSLSPATLYRITVCADTQYGCGQPSFVEQATLPAGNPDKPEIVNIVPGETWANVTFRRTESGKKEYNPAQEYYVEFKQTDATIKPWSSSYRAKDVLWINVTEVFPGVEYQMRVVAANQQYNTPSEPQTFRIGLAEPITTGAAGSSIWLIVLLIILALIILIIVIGCVVYRRRGSSYPVSAKEKEKDPKKKIAKDEAPFSEYSVPSLPVTSGASNASLISNKSGGEGGDSDMDSLLGEYEESEETKFNEDGSFIGQYGGPVRRLESVETGYVEAEGPGPKGPPLNTFV